MEWGIECTVKVERWGIRLQVAWVAFSDWEHNESKAQPAQGARAQP
jgi:hypothetical protein